MMKNTILLLLLIFGFFACVDDDSAFEASPEGLEIKFTPVAGGAMMHYTLPKNGDIFGMNVRYADSQGREVLKACGYAGDSVLLDGFTQALEVRARVSFVSHNNQESGSLDYQFKTLDSAPWAFFNDIKVSSSWNGFQVIYKSPEVVTGMAHVFYLGNNPLTQQKDTILVGSFPISRGGDTLNFILKQENMKNTVVIRTEDFKGYRVKQETYPDIDAFRTEQWMMTADNFNDFGLSVESETSKTGKKYLFDGEIKGMERMIAYVNTPLVEQRSGLVVCGTYVTGANAYEQPLILDLRERKTPAWIRMYRMYPMRAAFSAGEYMDLGMVWNGNYEDKLPCNLTVYGNAESPDPNSSGWVELGKFSQHPKASTAEERWSFFTESAIANLDEFEKKDPISVDIQFPTIDNTYRYLKIVVHNTFGLTNTNMNYNQNKHFSLHELEVYVKKN